MNERAITIVVQVYDKLLIRIGQIRDIPFNQFKVYVAYFTRILFPH